MVSKILYIYGFYQVLTVSGGGKRAKVSDSDFVIPVVINKPDILATDGELVKNVLGKTDFNITEWISTFDLDSLKDWV